MDKSKRYHAYRGRIYEKGQLVFTTNSLSEIREWFLKNGCGFNFPRTSWYEDTLENTIIQYDYSIGKVVIVHKNPVPVLSYEWKKVQVIEYTSVTTDKDIILKES